MKPGGERSGTPGILHQKGPTPAERVTEDHPALGNVFASSVAPSQGLVFFFGHRTRSSTALHSGLYSCAPPALRLAVASTSTRVRANCPNEFFAEEG